MIYKVWVIVEEIDEQHDHYEDVEQYAVTEVASLEEARRIVACCVDGGKAACK